MLDLRDASGGCDLGLRVQPGSRRSGIVGMHGDRLKVAVKAPAIEGRANEALVEFLAELCGIARGRVSIRRGLSGRDKTVHIDGVSAGSLRLVLAVHGVSEEKSTG